MTELVTILDKDGKAQKGKDPGLPRKELERLYRLMVMTRLLDERGLALQRQGRIGFYLQSTGQEASHLGAVAHGTWSSFMQRFLPAEPSVSGKHM